MGSRLSRITSRAPPKPLTAANAHQHDELDDSGDDAVEALRPTKRRRLNDGRKEASTSESSAGIAHRRPRDDVNIQIKSTDTRSLSRVPISRLGLPPSAFYGNPRSISDGTSSVHESRTSDPAFIDEICPTKPSSFQRAMRVNILSMQPLDPHRVENFGSSLRPNSSIEFNCICTVTIWGTSKDGYSQNLTLGSHDLCKKAQSCKILVTKDADGTLSRTVTTKSPFLFRPDDLCMTTRRSRPRKSQPEEVYDVADKYQIVVHFRRAGQNRSWPPFDIPPAGLRTPISSAIQKEKGLKNDLFVLSMVVPTRSTIVDAQMSVCYAQNLELEQSLQYKMSVEVKWSLPSHFTALTAKTSKPVGSSMANIALDSSPGQTKAVSPAQEIHDESAHDIPARGRRQRNDVNYNVRAKFREISGQEPKTTQIDDGEIKVSYSFGKPGAAEHNVKQRHEFKGFGCHWCEITQCETFQDLRLHLTTCHTNAKFSLRRGKPPHFAFFVEIKPVSHETRDIRQRTIQLNPSSTLLELVRYLNGDDAWVKRRYGSEHGKWPANLSKGRARDSSSSPSPLESWRSSPNTSTGTCDNRYIDPKVFEEQSRSKFRPVTFVPFTNKTLYDTVTKQVLNPGDHLPDSDDEVDEHWLTLKHRDCVFDFSDVTDEEKEYLNRWNPFICAERLTCPEYLNEALVKFAEQEKDWLLEKRYRLMEFTKHIEVFIMRGNITERDRKVTLDVFLNELQERKRKEKEKGNEEAEPEDVVMEDVPPPPLRNRTHCECGECPTGVRIMCTAKGCKARIYHPKCAKAQGRPVITRTWQCNNCHDNSS